MNSHKIQIIFISLIVFITSSSIVFSSHNDHHLEDHFANMNLDHDENSFGKLLNYGNDQYLSHLMATKLARATSSSRTINVKVDDYGANANGGDDTQAFVKAWEVACAAKNGVVIVSKNKVYNVKPITFQGPCKSTTTIKVYGTIKASTNSSAYKKDLKLWLNFLNVQNLRVEGGGTINGNGQVWWPKSCKINKTLPCKKAPTALTFQECNNLNVSDITIKNAQQMHITFQKCMNVRAVNVTVFSPRNSPNTDGIHVSETQNLVIRDCAIKTGDDCISIVSGSENIRATDITCGPGHGISIGSLGAGNSEAHVSNIHVERAKFSGSTNGVRIKTWQPTHLGKIKCGGRVQVHPTYQCMSALPLGGLGHASNITFENIVMDNVSNPIIIDQNYCDKNGTCPPKGSAVQISNIMYRNIQGTSASEMAMKFDCSKTFPCRGIELRNINLSLENEDNIGKAQTFCSNVIFGGVYNVNPTCSSHAISL